MQLTLLEGKAFHWKQLLIFHKWVSVAVYSSMHACRVVTGGVTLLTDLRYGIMVIEAQAVHLCGISRMHAWHVVVLSTRRMRSNKIDFLPVEDEVRKRRRLKDRALKCKPSAGDMKPVEWYNAVHVVMYDSVSCLEGGFPYPTAKVSTRRKN